MKIWTTDEINFLIKNYTDSGCLKCANSLGRSYQAIRMKAGCLGLKVKSETRSKLKVAMWEETPLSWRNVDASIFIDCKTKETAYILGFLWADGYLNKKSQHFMIRLELAQPDFDNVKNIWLSTGKWQISYRQRPNRKPQGILSTCQKPLYEFLQNNDYEIKSIASADKILSHIPNDLKPYWWRGYFDGDGCFYFNEKNHVRHASFAGSYEQDWHFLESLLTTLSVKYKIIKRHQQQSSHSVVRTADTMSIRNFGNYIYQEDDDIGLQRKRDKFNEMIIGRDAECTPAG